MFQSQRWQIARRPHDQPSFAWPAATSRQRFLPPKRPRLLSAWSEGSLLVLHGGVDKEVPVAQAKIWRRRLTRAKNLTAKIVAGGDHRAMVGGYRVVPVAAVITRWLDLLSRRQ